MHRGQMESLGRKRRRKSKKIRPFGSDQTSPQTKKDGSISSEIGPHSSPPPQIMLLVHVTGRVVCLFFGKRLGKPRDFEHTKTAKDHGGNKSVQRFFYRSCPKAVLDEIFRGLCAWRGRCTDFFQQRTFSTFSTFVSTTHKFLQKLWDTTKSYSTWCVTSKLKLSKKTPVCWFEMKRHMCKYSCFGWKNSRISGGLIFGRGFINGGTKNNKHIVFGN